MAKLLSERLLMRKVTTSLKVSARIGLVLKNFNSGGLENVVFNLYQGLKKIGYEVTIFVENGEDGYYADRVNREDKVFFNGKSDEFFTEIARRKINCLNYHYSTFSMAEVIRCGLSVIYTMHNCYTWLDDEEFSNKAAIIEQADAIIFVSTFVKNYYNTKSGSKHLNSKVVLNGLPFDQLRVAKAITKKQLNIDPSKFTFGQFASFYPIKYQLLALCAAEELLSNRDDFQLLFFGGVGDDVYFNKIQSLIKNSKASRHIKYMGLIPNEQVGGVLKGSINCAIATTMQEGNSISILEAAALNIPIIMTETGGYLDLISHNFKISTISLPIDTFELNSDVINKLSDQVNKRLLGQLVAEMGCQIDLWNKANSKVPRKINTTFPFSIENMVQEYSYVFNDSINIL
jgi:glycosyltransferase involved in cell wall biosynthesis